MVASDKYLKVYSSSTTQYKVTLTDYTGHVIKNGDYISTVLNELTKVQYPRGQYTVNLSGPYTLTDDDVTVLNTTSSYIQNQDIVIQGTGTFVAGGYAKGGDTNSYRFARVYPNFRSLTWKNIIFRQDFLDNSNSWYINANGHSMKFEDCTFTGPVIIDAGGNSTAGTSGSTLTVKNCINVNRIYANRTSNKTLGNTTITVDSCGGYGTAGVTIDPAGSGCVQKLTINVTDTTTTVDPTNRGDVSKISGNYVLNVTDSNIVFTTPTVSLTSYTATTNLYGNVVLTGTCTGRTSSSTTKGKATLNVIGTVKTQNDKEAYLVDFTEINISGELRLGNHANLKDSGFSYRYVRSNVTLSGNGKLILERLGSAKDYRTIQSLKSTSSDTEISFPYIYNGTSSSLTGRPLIVQTSLMVPDNGQLRVSTSLMPKHAGKNEYPLIQFDTLSSAKLSQYTWIADQRYYLKVGDNNSSQIVLRKDEYAPQVYQLKSSGVSLNAGDSLKACIDIYLRDPDRDAIDKTGSTLNKASNGVYPEGVQVYLSSQDVQKKDGVYDYVYNVEKGDKQLRANNSNTVLVYNELNAGATFTDINGQTISSTSESPIIHIQTAQLLFDSNKNYFIYARDIAGNWSKFLLDTKGPKLNKETWKQTLSYIDKAATTQEKNATYYVDAEYEDVQQSAVNDGTSDINNIGYFANATKYINANKNYAEVRWNTSRSWPCRRNRSTCNPQWNRCCRISRSSSRSA